MYSYWKSVQIYKQEAVKHVPVSYIEPTWSSYRANLAIVNLEFPSALFFPAPLH